jgi:hypothetical protein
MSAGANGDPGWHTPPADAERAGDRLRLTWYPSRQLTRVALFRVDGDRAILQHIRRIRSGRGETVDASINTQPELEDVPASLRTLVEADGYRVENGGDAE